MFDELEVLVVDSVHIFVEVHLAVLFYCYLLYQYYKEKYSQKPGFYVEHCHQFSFITGCLAASPCCVQLIPHSVARWQCVGTSTALSSIHGQDPYSVP